MASPLSAFTQADTSDPDWAPDLAYVRAGGARKSQLHNKNHFPGSTCTPQVTAAKATLDAAVESCKGPGWWRSLCECRQLAGGMIVLHCFFCITRCPMSRNISRACGSLLQVIIIIHPSHEILTNNSSAAFELWDMPPWAFLWKSDTIRGTCFGQLDTGLESHEALSRHVMITHHLPKHGSYHTHEIMNGF